MGGITRREFLIAAGGLLAARGARAAKPGRTYRIGAFFSMAGLAAQPYLAALREGLAAHGFVEGRNLEIALRYPSTRAEVRDLVPKDVDAYFVLTTAFTEAVLALGGSQPVVFAWVAEPVASGFVKTLGRPGGRATGVRNRHYELGGKRLELLRELLPPARRVAVIVGTASADVVDGMRSLQIQANQLGIDLILVEAAVYWSLAMREALARRADAVLVMTPFAPFGMRYAMEEVVRFMLEHRMPTMFSDAESVELGGLISYGADPEDDVRRAAAMLAQVLNGVDPGAIAVDQTARFKLVVNMRSAHAMGLVVPQSILIRADRVIE